MKVLDDFNDYNGDVFVKMFGPEGQQLRNRMARKRREAQERHLEYNLTTADVAMFGHKLLANGCCDYSGLPLQKHDPSDAQSIRYSPTLERIDDKKGYIRGNVCVVMQRVNQLKDVLLDKVVNTKISAGDQHLIRHMVENMNKLSMESLKDRYVPKHELVLTDEGEIVEYTEELKAQADAESDKLVLHGIANHSITVDKDVEFVPEEAEKVVVPSMPEDVIIAEKYAALLKYLAKTGKEITISFAHFKAAYKAKRCFITGKDLTPNMLPVIMDHNKPIETGNLKFAEEKAASALNDLCVATGLSVADLVKNLKKVAS